MKARPLQHNPLAAVTMLQRSKSAGKQAAKQMGYVPLAATQEGGGASNAGRYNRTVSPGPDQMAKRPPGVKRTIAPGQVGSAVRCACMHRGLQHTGLSACVPLAAGARSAVEGQVCQPAGGAGGAGAAPAPDGSPAAAVRGEHESGLQGPLEGGVGVCGASKTQHAQDIDMTERMETAPKQRISVYCIAESLDRKLLQKKLEARGPMFMVTQYPDVLYGHYFSLETGQSMGDMCATTLPRFLLLLACNDMCCGTP